MNDPLDDLFNNIGTYNSERTEAAVRRDHAGYKPASERFEEGCAKCGGSGRFRTYSGRDGGECFACKGAGKRTFKTSAPAREKAREQAATRKADRVVADLRTFELANPAVMAWLKAETAKAQPFAFAVAMVEAIVKFGDLTDNQLATCERLAAKAAERVTQRASRAVDAPAVDASAIEQAFATARQRAAVSNQLGIYTKPLKLTADGVSVKVQPGTVGSQWEGQLFFKSLDGERKLGFVKGGKFIRQFACTDVEEAAVLKCAAEPKDALIAYAKAWSKCGVCNRTLLNKESIERGIGPICLAKFGW